MQTSALPAPSAFKPVFDSCERGGRGETRRTSSVSTDLRALRAPMVNQSLEELLNHGGHRGHGDALTGSNSYAFRSGGLCARGAIRSDP